MLVLLHVLEEAIETFANGGCDEAHIAGICLQLRVDIPRRFGQYAEPTLAEADFVRYHRQLTALYGRVHGLGSPIAAMAVGDLLDHQEHLYSDLLDATKPLPDFRAEKLKTTVYDALPSIVKQLRGKQVPPLYLHELGYAVDALFTQSKPPVLLYHHSCYLPDFIGMLRQLADDARPKDWPKRFVEALVNYNFNYMGFFNRWREASDAEFATANKADRAPLLVSDWYNTLHHHTPVPDLAFIPRQPSLLDHMAAYIGTKATSLLKPHSAQPDQPPTAIDTTLNSGLLSLDFHYRYKVGYYPYANQLEAAKAYSVAHHSKTGRHISPNSLTRFDKTELYSEAILYHSDLDKIINLLRQDFKL